VSGDRSVSVHNSLRGGHPYRLKSVVSMAFEFFDDTYTASVSSTTISLPTPPSGAHASSSGRTRISRRQTPTPRAEALFAARLRHRVHAHHTVPDRPCAGRRGSPHQRRHVYWNFQYRGLSQRCCERRQVNDAAADNPSIALLPPEAVESTHRGDRAPTIRPMQIQESAINSTLRHHSAFRQLKELSPK
jgi:hypothetical protein